MAGGTDWTVKLLLNRGAACGISYGIALYPASEKGHEQIATLLLNKGAEVDGQRGLNGIALYNASAEGHEEIVKLLLDKGAEVNAQGGNMPMHSMELPQKGHKRP